ncbi:MAG TPA: DUF4440 domain-containing protein [Gemmatimonadaceae bacterium]|jgi:uncharacterized protein (TIGR02246 family)|nr:DUF4440 domain-containing protein [Gemmatimonadaceae bacterium]
MRSPCLALLTLVAVAACTTQQARRTDTTSPAAATLAGAPATDAAAVRRAIDSANARFDAAALKGDTAALAGFYADDAVFMGANMPAERGHEAIAKGFAGMLAAMKPTAFKLQTQDLIVSGEYVIETGTYDITSQVPKATKPMHDVGKYLVAWRKQADGSYKIVRDIANSDLPAGK